VGPAGGAPIAQVPTTFNAGANEVVYHPEADWLGKDSFTFYATDGGTSPLGGQSNTATVSIEVADEITVAYQVAASADDVQAVGFGTTQTLSDPALELRGHKTGMRFRNVNIPRGAQVVKATLRIRACSNGRYTQGTTLIRAEATDDASEFDNTNRRVNNISSTSASQSWNLSETVWTADTWYESPDIRQLVQEIINRSGWSPGNAIVIACGGAGTSREFWAYDGYPQYAPQLEITYRP
jgi:hypothetical protein